MNVSTQNLKEQIQKIPQKVQKITEDKLCINNKQIAPLWLKDECDNKSYEKYLRYIYFAFMSMDDLTNYEQYGLNEKENIKKIQELEQMIKERANPNFFDQQNITLIEIFYSKDNLDSFKFNLNHKLSITKKGIFNKLYNRGISIDAPNRRFFIESVKNRNQPKQVSFNDIVRMYIEDQLSWQPTKLPVSVEKKPDPPIGKPTTQNKADSPTGKPPPEGHTPQ